MATVLCPKCHQLLPAWAAFCGECGTPLRGNPGNPAPNPAAPVLSRPSDLPAAAPAAPPARRKRRGLFIGLAVLLVIILGGTSLGALGLRQIGPLAPLFRTAGQITEFALPNPASIPTSITLGPDNNLWFTENTAQRFGRITPQGKITEFSLPDAADYAYFIITGPDKNLWLAGETIPSDRHPTAWIARRTQAGTLSKFPLPSAPEEILYGGLTSGPDGNIWFTDDANNLVERITPQGKITEFALPSSIHGAGEITSGPDGNLWFTVEASNMIGRMTPQGKLTQFTPPTSESGPMGITSGPDGNLWFTEFYVAKIGRITPQGQFAEFSLPASPDTVDEITSGPDGNLWFTDYTFQHGDFTAGSIGRITPQGGITKFPLPDLTSGETIHLGGITAGPDGNLWYTRATGLGAKPQVTGNWIGRITSGK